MYVMCARQKKDLEALALVFAYITPPLHNSRCVARLLLLPGLHADHL